MQMFWYLTVIASIFAIVFILTRVMLANGALRPARPSPGSLSRVHLTGLL
jgi:hypothetical protein